MIHTTVDVVVAIASALSILDYFGFKPKQPWPLTPLSRKAKLFIMLALVAAALGMSGYNFYRSVHPRVVEKVVTIEKPVDKIIYKDCPPAKLRPAKTAPTLVAPGSTITATTNAPNSAAVGINSGTITVNPDSPEKKWIMTEEICGKLLTPIRYRSGNPLTVSVGAFISDPDGANVVQQILRCLPTKVPGWDVHGAVLPALVDGTVIYTSTSNEPIAESLRDGIRAAGFNSPRIDTSQGMSENEIDIAIGKRALMQP